METARSATEADLPDVVRLWAEAVADLDGQRGGALLARALTRPALTEWATAALADPDRLVVLGLIDGVRVGLTSVVTSSVPSEVGGGPLGTVELIYVEPPARQVGVAEAMMALVTEWAVGRGLVGLDAPALPGSRPAKSFFEVNGYQARLLIMHRPLGEGDR